MKPHLRTTVATLLNCEVSQHEIQRKTGVDRKTIRAIERAMAATNSPTPSTDPGANSPTPSTGSVGQSPPPRPPTPAPEARAPKDARSACEPHREWIEAQVRLGRNATAIYQELVDRHGFTHRYSSVKRFCRGLRRCEPEQFDRLEHFAGEETQVDYGEGAPTRTASGRYRRPRLFVMTLKYSGRSFRKVVWKSSSEVWARLHEEAFRYFGGCTKYCVLDNLREGVISPDIYEPELNRVYAAMLAHYGVVADPARVRDANRKGTVENAIKHTQDTALKGKRFESIEAQNAHLMHWEETWAATRIHGRAKRQVEAMFQEERAHLKPLPVEPYRYFTEGTRSVGDDTTIQVDHAYYAARPARIGDEVLVRIYAHEIEIRDLRTLELLRRHARATRRGEVKLPEEERVFNPSRQTRQILARAEEIGPNTHALCEHLFKQRGREGQKSMWGIVGLTPRYPACIVERAVAAALARGFSSYKAVRNLAEQLLAQALERIDSDPFDLPLPGAAALTQQHELIREPAEYAEFFARSNRSNNP